jgi:hypothetical protein
MRAEGRGMGAALGGGERPGRDGRPPAGWLAYLNGLAKSKMIAMTSV